MKQSFSVVNGVRVEADPDAPKVLNASRSLNSTALMSTVNDDPEPLPCSRNDMPDLNNKSSVWLNNAGKVIRFFGYFKEGVNESAAESFRVRKLTILYYLEDGTIQMIEHAVENAGMPQGEFLKRCIIPKDGNTGGVYELKDLYINARISVYCRTIHIVDCDAPARKHCEITDEPIDYPEDMYTSARARHMASETGADMSVKRNVKKGPMKKFMEASLGNTVNNNKLQSFLENDRCVLRFTGAWDNRNAMFGDYYFYTIHYYLADDTVEVLEQHQPNNGCDPYPVFLKRQRLPKKNVTHDPNGRPDEEDPNDYIHWTDLDVQKPMPLMGREVLLISADTTTRQHYLDKMGRPLAENIDHKYIEEPQPIPRNQTPEHSGFGSEQDSMASCGALVPKPPKTEFDKKGVKLPNTVLRFSAKMDTTRYDDKNRIFVIMYILATKEIMVREPPQRNSGVVGGQYLSKMKLKRPDGMIFEASDFFAGAKVKFNATTFIVNDVDEHTLIHMDNNPNEFPLADVNYCISLIRNKMAENSISASQLFSAMDTNGDGKVAVTEFLPLMKDCFNKVGVDVGDTFPDQVAITIFRTFDADKSGTISLQEFCSQISSD